VDDRALRAGQRFERALDQVIARLREHLDRDVIGTTSSTIRCRTKSKSVCDADGNPASILLKPILTSKSNIRRLRCWFIGSINAWLPSRRSTLHQIGRADHLVGPGAVFQLDGFETPVLSCGVSQHGHG
jgi:hypothetical protein